MADHKKTREPRSEDDLADALDRIFQRWEYVDKEAITKLFVKLPDWLPEPILPQIRQAVEALRNAGQSGERIAEIVTQARENRLEVVPGTVLDVSDFFKSANYLAYIQWALSLNKARAIEELAGSRAVRDYSRSKRGNEAQYKNRFGGAETPHERNSRIRKEAEALRGRNPRLSLNAIATKLSQQEGLGERQIKRILSASASPKK